MKARLSEEYNQKVKPNIQMNMYDLNKQIIKQMNQVDDDSIIDHRNEFFTPFINSTNNKYYMLLCRELNYYTLFHRTGNEEDDKFNSVIEEIINNFGTWITFNWGNEETKDSIEYWVRITMPGGDEDKFEDVYCFILFPYDIGLVEVY